MQILQHSAAALQRNLSALLLYIGVNVTCGLVAFAVDFVTRSYEPEAEAIRSPSPIDVALILVLVGVIAVNQSIVFARMGRDIDRPLWKVPGDREALRRFFGLWFIVNLTISALFLLAAMDYGSGEAQSLNYLLLILTFIVTLVAVPAGACIMFAGHVKWQDLVHNLTPLVRQIGLLLPILGVTFFQFVFFLFVQTTQAQDLAADVTLFNQAIDLVFTVVHDTVTAYLDCLVFAMTWQLLRHDRDTADEIDLDF